MNIKKKLANPFALVAQGFAAGALLFFATAPSESDSSQQPPAGQSAAVAEAPTA